MTDLLVPADLETTLQAVGIRPARVDEEEVWARCPGHLDRTGSEDHQPSWSINRETGVHHCFSCGYSGTLTTLLADRLGTSNIFEIHAFLRERGASIVQAIQRRRSQPLRSAPAARPVSESMLAVYTDPPRWALRQRRLSAEACAHHGVRWDGRREAWVLPIRERDGALLGWQIKSDRIFRNFPVGVKKSQTLFGAHVFTGTLAILVESPLDAVRLTAEGHPGALASYGVEVSPAQLKLVLELADTLLLALDNDAAGRRKTRELLREWGPRQHTSTINYTQAEDCKDPGEMTAAQIRWAIEHAEYSLKALMTRER